MKTLWITRTVLIASLTLCLVTGTAEQTRAQQKQESGGVQESGQTESQQPEISPESLKQKYSYLLGYNMVKDFQRNEIEFDINELLKGIQEAADGKAPAMTDEEIQSVEVAFQRMIVRQQQEQMAKLADENMRKGADFLKANLLQEGVKELENGLQYQVLVAGDGESPRITDTVKVNYKAMFIDGTVWEQTSGTKPIPMTVGGAGIRGIVTALQKMKAGDKWKLFIPSDLAFGVQGQPPVIGPNQALIYELELVEVVK